MSETNTSTRYGTVHRALHWTVAVLVLGQLLVGDVILLLSPGRVPLLSGVLHPTVGIAIFALTVWRLAVRSRGPLPEEPRDIGVLGQTMSSLTHYWFYFLLLLTPVVGYFLSSSMGLPIRLLGIPLPHPIGASARMETFFFWLHLASAASIGLLVVLHAAGALAHEFVLRDNVLRRMLGAPAMTAERQRRQETWPDTSPAARARIS